MKRIIVTLILMGCIVVSYAQKDQPVVPYPISIDSITGLITYQGVVDVKGTTKEELYKRINQWFQTYYKNPSDVIRENDSVKYVITGKPRMRLIAPPNKEGVVLSGNNLVQYTITVAARDSRFRYELTSFNWLQTSYYACERWLDTKATSYKPVYNDYLQQIEKLSLEEIASLKKAVTKEKAIKDKDNW